MRSMAWFATMGVLAAVAGCGESHGTVSPDGGSGMDAAADGGRFDGALRDGALPDGAPPDAGSMDGGASDGALPDGSPGDAGMADGGISGECTSPADCGGDACLEITPGGYRTCEQPIDEATGCHPTGFDACCTTADCDAGLCVTSVAPGNFCGGIIVLGNRCVADECQVDGDCATGQVCMPAGAYGYPVNTCVTAYCKTDADCTAEAGGVCAPVTQACCTKNRILACVYPSDGCETDADCPQGYCQITQERAHCEPGGPICPY